MTTFKKNLMLAVAACTIAAGSAAAQTYRAQIPFNFRAGNTMLTAGTYDITVDGSVKTVRVRNADTFRAILLLPAGITGARNERAQPALRLLCAASKCSLDSLWVGGYQGEYRFPRPKLGRDDMARVEVVELTLVKAD